MPALDGMVIEHLVDKLCTPERLVPILEAHIAQSADAEAKRRGQLGQARKALTESGGEVDRLIKLVMKGLVEDDDPDFRSNLEAAKHRRQAAAEWVRRLEAPRDGTANRLTPERLTRFARAMRDALLDGDVRFRKAYLQLFVERITVGDTEVHLCGADRRACKAASSGQQITVGDVVPSFVPEWRPVGNSNPCWCRGKTHIA
jgi:site-specific DNA recombinase